MWRETRASLGPVASTLADDWCRFETERAVVVVVEGSLAPSVDHAWHSDEGVDVLVLTVRSDAAALGRGLAHALAVPAGAAQLAIVLRAPDAGGQLVETTLAVFAGR